MSELNNTLIINGETLPINGERNVLELARKHGIFIPSFCYHSGLSTYGACRLCLVEIERMGIQAACCTAPRPGMVIKTNTEEITEIRKVAVQLLLANHKVECPTCEKSDACSLLKISRSLGIKENMFEQRKDFGEIDESSPSLVRDPSKCILCGDCVRACKEIQGIGVLDFAFRGSKSVVIPAFGKGLNKVECVNCGLCSKVCPTGAIMVKNETDKVWDVLYKKEKVAVVSIAPAVRVAIGDMFGLKTGEIATGKMVAALKKLGFDYVFDTSYGADLTVLEEGQEFIHRKTQGGVLPQFTSCCPAWFKYCEEFYPDLIPNLSSAKSPQQMLNSAIKEYLPQMIGKTREDIYTVSIMPCTAKKYEIKQKKFTKDGKPSVDVVLTTIELGNMIKQAGIDFANLEPESFDMPFGAKTGAGVIFGVTGGVTEAVLRYAYEEITKEKLTNVDFKDVRGLEGVREAEVELNGIKIKIGIVHTLKNAKKVCDLIREGKCEYDLIEVMTCPGGCINGAGQPKNFEPNYIEKRAKGLYAADKNQDLHKSQENLFVTKLYNDFVGEVGNETAHHLFHTSFAPKQRIKDENMDLIGAVESTQKKITVCVGRNCLNNGSQALLKKLIDYVQENKLDYKFSVKGVFCFENCDKGPYVAINGKAIEHATFEKAVEAIQADKD